MAARLWIKPLAGCSISGPHRRVVATDMIKKIAIKKIANPSEGQDFFTGSGADLRTIYESLQGGKRAV